jgi:hypothetical protein
VSAHERAAGWRVVPAPEGFWERHERDLARAVREREERECACMPGCAHECGEVERG